MRKDFVLSFIQNTTDIDCFSPEYEDIQAFQDALLVCVSEPLEEVVTTDICVIAQASFDLTTSCVDELCSFGCDPFLVDALIDTLEQEFVLCEIENTCEEGGDDEDDDLQLGLIVGGAVGGAIIVLLLVVIVLLSVKLRSSNPQTNQKAQVPPNPLSVEYSKVQGEVKIVPPKKSVPIPALTENPPSTVPAVIENPPETVET